MSARAGKQGPKRPMASRLLDVTVLALGTLMSLAGLFWAPGSATELPGHFGQGLYWRDTAFVAGSAQGSDVFGLVVIVPAGLWALFGRVTPTRRLVMAGVHTWWFYLSASLAFGAVAFNEAFPLYVTLMPVSLWALVAALGRLAVETAPRALPAFLIGAGGVTGLAWGLLLWIEMTTGGFPPQSHYTVRTTYAADLGLIAPGCIAAGIGIARRRAWGLRLGLPLLWLAAFLLPMMAVQTLMQLQAGVTFGPEAAAPFIGFGLVSGGAIWLLARMPRHLGLVDDT